MSLMMFSCGNLKLDHLNVLSLALIEVELQSTERTRLPIGFDSLRRQLPAALGIVETSSFGPYPRSDFRTQLAYSLENISPQAGQLDSLFLISVRKAEQ
jgi:hypothetical protein